MGYACPVCSDPQADAGHLANHLAFTAMLGDDAHEAWLDEHAPGWAEMGEDALADIVVDEVEETEFPQVFEDTAGGLEDAGEPPAERSGALFDDEPPADQQSHGYEPGQGHHRHGQGHDHQHDHAGGQGASAGGDAPIDGEAEAILEEAREMTRRMLEDDADADADAGGEDSAVGDDDGSDDADGAEADADADADNNE